MAGEEEKCSTRLGRSAGGGGCRACGESRNVEGVRKGRGGGAGIAVGCAAQAKCRGRAEMQGAARRCERE